MLTTHPHSASPDAPPATAAWIDLLTPSEEERELVHQTTGLHVPTLAELSEIETSSRLQRRAGVLTMSVPVVLRLEGQEPLVTPVGFVLTRERLITVRFAHLPVFESYGAACRAEPPAPGSGFLVFLGLLEGVVDRLADVLEREGEELDGVSRRIFHSPGKGPHRPSQVDRELRALLRTIGSIGDMLGKLRDTLLGVGRIAQFVSGSAADWCTQEERPRLDTIRADVASLNDYDAHLSNKVQFLLDASLGLIGVEQSNIIKVLTVVSIVGIPPTFVASLYGMNFKVIPELNWSFGYYYALGLMLVSAIAPVVWFRLRGWL